MSTKHIVIDVREPEEFADGHVAGALNVPLSGITSDEQLSKMDKNASIIVYCRSGSRSAMALEYLKQQGFVKLTNGINQQNTERLLVGS